MLPLLLLLLMLLLLRLLLLLLWLLLLLQATGKACSVGQQTHGPSLRAAAAAARCCRGNALRHCSAAAGAAHLGVSTGVAPQPQQQQEQQQQQQQQQQQKGCFPACN